MNVMSMARPARLAPRINASRFFCVAPTKAFSRLSNTNCSASSAYNSEVSLALMLQMDSMAWHSASRPEWAVTSAGRFSVNRQSSTACVGRICGLATEYFTPSSYTTAKCVASLPVPAVVGTAMSGRPGMAGPGLRRTTSAAGAGWAERWLMSLAVSMTEPPPTASTTSTWACRKASMPLCTSGNFGFGSKSAKMVTSCFANVGERRSAAPDRFHAPASVTKKTRWASS